MILYARNIHSSLRAGTDLSCPMFALSYASPDTINRFLQGSWMSDIQDDAIVFLGLRIG
jgi:hypothetical protein